MWRPSPRTQWKIPVLDTEFTDLVELEVILSEDELPRIKNAVTEATGARAGFLSEKPVTYGIRGKERTILS